MNTRMAQYLLRLVTLVFYCTQLLLTPTYAQDINVPQATGTVLDANCSAFPNNVGTHYLLGNTTQNDPSARALEKFSNYYSTSLNGTSAKAVLSQSAKARLRYLPFLTHEIYMTVSDEGTQSPTAADNCFIQNFDQYSTSALFREARRKYILLCHFLNKDECDLPMSAVDTMAPLSFDASAATEEQIKTFFHILRAPNLSTEKLQAVLDTYGTTVKTTKNATAHDIDALSGNFATIGTSISTPATAPRNLGSVLNPGTDETPKGVYIGIAAGVAAAGIGGYFGVKWLMGRSGAANDAAGNMAIRAAAAQRAEEDRLLNATIEAQRRQAAENFELQNANAGTYCPPQPVLARFAAIPVGSEICQLGDESDVSEESIAEDETEFEEFIEASSSEAEAIEATTASETAAASVIEVEGIAAAAETGIEAAAAVTASVAALPEIAVAAAVAGLGYLIYHFATDSERSTVSNSAGTPDLSNYVPMLKKAAQTPVSFQHDQQHDDPKHKEIHNRVTINLINNLFFDDIGKSGVPSPLIKLPIDSGALSASTDFIQIKDDSAVAAGSVKFSYARYAGNETTLPKTLGPTYVTNLHLPQLILPYQNGKSFMHGFAPVDPRNNGTEKLMRLINTGNDRLGAVLYSRGRNGKTLSRNWRTTDIAGLGKVNGESLGDESALSNTFAVLATEANGFEGTDVVQLTIFNGEIHVNVYSPVSVSGRQEVGDLEGCSVDRHHCIGYAPFSESTLSGDDLGNMIDTKDANNKPTAMALDMDGDGISELALFRTGRTDEACDNFSFQPCLLINVLKLKDKNYQSVGRLVRGNVFDIDGENGETLSRKRESVFALDMTEDYRAGLVFLGKRVKYATENQPRSTHITASVVTLSTTEASAASSLQQEDLVLTDGSWAEIYPREFSSEDWAIIPSVNSRTKNDLALIKTSSDKRLFVHRFPVINGGPSGNELEEVALTDSAKAIIGSRPEVSTSSPQWQSSPEILISFPSGISASDKGGVIAINRPVGKPSYELKKASTSFSNANDWPFQNFRGTIPLRFVESNSTYLPKD